MNLSREEESYIKNDYELRLKIAQAAKLTY
jgi:hypothetical protein